MLRNPFYPRLRRVPLFLALFTALSNPAHSASPLKSVFKGEVAAFSLFDPQQNAWIRHNADRAAMRYSPCSTFKIPNALIALEEGPIKDENQVLKWDPALDPKKPHWPEAWAKDQTLTSAIRDSVVWFFQRLERKIGKTGYEKYLKNFRYGNRDISGGLDRFWLSSSLRISADEQVAFLRRFYEGDLGVAPRSSRVVQDALILERDDNALLSGKTGACELNSGRVIGWLVGKLETPSRVYYYALNVEGKNYAEIAPKRKALVKAAFSKLGIPVPASD